VIEKNADRIPINRKFYKSRVKDNPVDSTSVMQRSIDGCSDSRLLAPALFWI